MHVWCAGICIYGYTRGKGCVSLCVNWGGVYGKEVLRKVGVYEQNRVYLDKCVYTCVLERDVSESVFSCVPPVLTDKYQRVPALGGVCISECVLGVLPLASAGRFSWQGAQREGCLEGSEASWSPCPAFEGSAFKYLRPMGHLMRYLFWEMGFSLEKVVCVVGNTE